MSAGNISANFVACRKKSINHRSLPGLPLAADISRGIAIYSDAYSIKCIQNMSLIERMAAMSYGQGADAKINAGWRGASAAAMLSDAVSRACRQGFAHDEANGSRRPGANTIVPPSWPTGCNEDQGRQSMRLL